MATIFATPAPDEAETAVLEMIAELRVELGARVAEPRRWVGGLRRLSLARAVQASNSIEGYNATLDDVVAAVDGEQPLDGDIETKFAVEGYRDAMTYVLQLAREPAIEIDEGLLRALHFMMLKHDLSKNPGRWRPGSIFVRREPSGDIVYEGPDSDLIPRLISAMLDELRTTSAPVIFRAAMAHLNLVMIHPFSDGNGRMARCLQTLVLARERVVAPVFSSIEEYLGRNTLAYYEILAEVGQGGWNRGRDSQPWIRFCLTAHYRQAKTLLRRIQEAERLWVGFARLAQARRLRERSIGALSEAGMGLRLRNATYRSIVSVTAGEEISELTATRDLKAIVDAGLFEAVGERRGRHYVARGELTAIWQEIRSVRTLRAEDDPFTAVEAWRPGQLELASGEDS